MNRVRAAALAVSVAAGLAVLSAPSAITAAVGDEADHCESAGGAVQLRQPMYGTNNDPSTWIALGDPVAVCRFAADDEAQSKIHVDLVTLGSAQPTLAALAYLARAPRPVTTDGANPATALCIELGGTSAFGAGLAGGGLVLSDAPDGEIEVVVPCTFADGSFIDDWGIAYYADGTVRGTDLADAFRFEQTALPPVFG